MISLWVRSFWDGVSIPDLLELLVIAAGMLYDALDNSGRFRKSR